MSHFRALTEHPKTKKMEMADWLDDYYGHHRYGIKFPRDKKVCREEEVKTKGTPR